MKKYNIDLIILKRLECINHSVLTEISSILFSLDNSAYFYIILKNIIINCNDLIYGIFSPKKQWTIVSMDEQFW
jgi:hypothetical protein